MTIAMDSSSPVNSHESAMRQLDFRCGAEIYVRDSEVAGRWHWSLPVGSP